jgi:rubrerythrin
MDREQYFSAFKLAIEEEQKAHELYSTLAEMSTDPETKKIFEQFARDELEHRRKLMDRYSKLKGKTP